MIAFLARVGGIRHFPFFSSTMALRKTPELIARPFSPNYGTMRMSSRFFSQSLHSTTMHKTKILTLALLTGALIATPIVLQASGPPSQSVQPIVSSQAEGIEWVRLATQQYPEILWLADAQVRKTEEGQATLKSSYSELLFGQKLIEFDRTIMTLRCLKLILEGTESAYQALTKAQPAEHRLSRDSFDKLHAQAMALIKKNDLGLSKEGMVQAMEASLVLGDMGKSEKARELFKPYGVHSPDHDDFHGEALQILKEHPELCPTFEQLSPAAQKLLIESANLAHYGHITHLEGGPQMFSRLKQSGPSSTALAFDLFVHTCDVAGALGHVDNQSSLVYTEQTHLAMQGMAEACRILSDPQKGEKDAYNAYLSLRASWLGLSPECRVDRALTRVGAMLRLFTPEEGRLIKDAIRKLNTETRDRIISQLDIEDGKEFGRTPTYMPAVLVNLANNPQLGATKGERISQAVTLGLPFISRVLEKQRELLAQKKADPNVPLNFNLAAGVAKNNPAALAHEFTIDSEGNIKLSQ